MLSRSSCKLYSDITVQKVNLIKIRKIIRTDDSPFCTNSSFMAAISDAIYLILYLAFFFHCTQDYT